MRALGLVVAATLLVPPAWAGECPPAGGFEAAGAEAHGPNEIRLSDGRVVKLAGLDVPDAVAADARAALARHLAGAPLRFVPLLPAPDRYGRVLAAVATEGASPVWLEGALVGAGLARANPAPGETACLPDLMAAEAGARVARRGLWSVEGLGATRGDDGAAIERLRGRFAVVEGAIVSVGLRDTATFLNLGRDWNNAVTVVITRADRARIEAAHGPLRDLRGARVRVRGMIAPEGQPRLRIGVPGALEILARGNRT
jgi:hypothetical protein